MTRLVLSPSYQQALHEAGLDCFSTFHKNFSKASATHDGVLVQRHPLPGTDRFFYFKEYCHSPASWKFIGRPSKAECEFNNYQVFKQAGLPCPEPMAWGEERDALGRLRRAFIATEEIPNAIPLADLMRAGPASPLTSNQRRSILSQLALGTARLHQQNFFHHDLVWRNFLITRDPGGTAKAWWIDCPRGGKVRFSWNRRGRLLKDLASLDKSGWRFASLRERLRFTLAYCRRQPEAPLPRELIRQVSDYRRRRWPEDWGEK